MKVHINTHESMLKMLDNGKVWNEPKSFKVTVLFIGVNTNNIPFHLSF